MSHGGAPLQPKRGCIFVSYSHADKAWLERLRIILKPYPVHEQLWIDPYIQVGDRWEREIEGAMQQAAVGLLLLSTDFFASDFILDNELPALREASDARGLRMFCVPVGATGPLPRKRFGLDGYQWARSPDSPLDLLEPAQWKAALVQMAEALQALWDQDAASAGASAGQGMPAHDRAGTSNHRAEAQAQPAAVSTELHFHAPVTFQHGSALQTGSAARFAAVLGRAQVLEPLVRSASGRARLHGAPALPPHFVVREQELRELRRAVLELQQARFGISGAPRGTKAGLHGQGGIGKTVLATALVHDDEVQATFSDGIYWLTLGQEPNPVALLSELAAMLGLPDEQRDLGGLTTALRGALHDQRCLLVLDDVWQPAHAQAFDVLGGAGRTLITSRDELLLHQLGAATRRMEAMAPGSARSLLAQWANQDVTSLPALAEEIARRCGYLPLALALCGAQVHDGCSWPDVLEALRAGDLEFLDHPHGSVFKSMSASVQALPEDERARYRQLAIFPEDIPVPQDVIVRLWSAAGLSGPRARKLLRAFAGRSLLNLSAEPDPTVTFHDLQRDYLRLIAEDLPAEHARLLDAYARTLPADEPEPYRWRALPVAEQYMWKHLSYHMQEAERVQQMHALVRDVGWLQAKMAASGVGGLQQELQALLQAAPTAELAQLERAVRLESGWLYQVPQALPSLLYNRLRSDGLSEREIVDGLLRGVPRLPARVRHAVELGGAERRTLTGHSAGVTGCALSADGKTVVSASDDTTLKVWDAETGAERVTLRGHSGRITGCALSADGTTVVSASYDETLKVWDAGTGAERVTLRGHSGGIYACALSADGKTVVSASDDTTLKVWDALTGAERATLRGHSGGIYGCALSADGKTVVSASDDTTLKVWDAATGAERVTLRGHRWRVNGCALSADGKTVVSGSYDTTLRVWDAQTGAERVTLRGHSSCVNGCALSADGKTVVSASDDRTLKVWDTQTGAVRVTLRGHSEGSYGCALSADGKTTVSASYDRTLKVWDTRPGAARAPLRGHSGRVVGCVLSADGKTVVSASYDRTLKLRDAATGAERVTLRGHSGRVNGCTLSADGKTVVSASNDKTLKVWDAATGAERVTLTGHSDRINGCALSADGKTVISASNDKTLKVWDAATGLERATLRGHLDWVSGCALSADGKTVVSASEDNTLKVWDAQTGVERVTLRGHSRQVTGCALSADGQTVVSASDDRTLKVWDAATGAERVTLRGHSGGLYGCALSADGQTVVSASDDKTLKLWDVQSGACLSTVCGVAEFHSVAVAPGIIVAGDALGNVWMLDWNPDERLDHPAPQRNPIERGHG